MDDARGCFSPRHSRGRAKRGVRAMRWIRDGRGRRAGAGDAPRAATARLIRASGATAAARKLGRATATACARECATAFRGAPVKKVSSRRHLALASAKA